MKYFAGEGLRNFVCSLGHLAGIAEDYLSSRPRDGLCIRTVRETTPLGTGGAILLAAEAIPEADPLVVTNGDSLILADLTSVWTVLDRESVDGVIVGVSVRDATRYGTLDVDTAGRLRGFVEKRGGPGIANAGVYIIKRRVLGGLPARIPLSMEFTVFPTLLDAGVDLRVVPFEAPFIDIGTPEDLQRADDFVELWLA